VVSGDNSNVYVVSNGQQPTDFGLVERLSVYDLTVDNAVGFDAYLGQGASIAPNGYLFIAGGANGVYVIDTTNDDDIIRGSASPLLASNLIRIFDIYAHPDVSKLFVAAELISPNIMSVEVLNSESLAYERNYDGSSEPQVIIGW